MAEESSKTEISNYKKGDRGIPGQFIQSFHQHQPICLKVGETHAPN